MKSLLINRHFVYEIVDFPLLWQTNTYHLGGVCSIQLSYVDIYKSSNNYPNINMATELFYHK